MKFGDVRLPERFWIKVVPEPMSGCWLWVGASHREGYGTYSDHVVPRRTIGAHRAAFRALFGSLTPGLVVDHLCNVTCCVNPLHLREVTDRVNILRGTAFTAVNAAKDYCKNGHPFNADNTHIIIGRRGRMRQCRACNAVAVRRYKSRRKRHTRKP